MKRGRLESEGPVVQPLTIALERGEVRRSLGYHPGHRGSPRVEACLDALWRQACGLLRPRGAWRIVEEALAAQAGMPRAGGRGQDHPGEPVGGYVGLGLCTVGPALETESEQRSRAGDLLEAVVLDAIGSAAAEAAADALNRILCDKGRALGLVCLPRVSPGYGDWDMACQARLLALLPASELGIALTSGQMMRPRKSVSFAATFATAPADCDAPRASDAPPSSACERCGLVRCRHRQA